MRRYRYLIFDQDKTVVFERAFQAATDAAAVTLGHGWRDGRPAEIWSTHLMIKRWE